MANASSSESRLRSEPDSGARKDKDAAPAKIAKGNARLDLFLASPSITIHPVVIGAAPFFTIFALPTCHDLTMNNGTQINGLIYAPNTILNGAGHASICGAIAANTFGCQGTFDFHYDLAFNKPRYLPPVRVISWNEL